MAFRRSIYKSRAQLEAMVEPGRITAAALSAVRAAVRPGITTGELDAIAERVIRDRGAESNFKLVRGYRHTTCISVNDQVVHGIPGARVLHPGDIVSIDCGAQFRGWNGDSAISVVVPDEGAAGARRRALGAVRSSPRARCGPASPRWPRRRTWATSALPSRTTSSARVPAPWRTSYGILREYVGHGIGRKMHEAPSLFNYRTPDRGAEVRPGLVLAIEPMVTAGSDKTYVEDDDWTVTTVDGSDGSHWEHSVALHDDGIWVLTAEDGGAAGLAPFGITPVPVA